MPIDLAKTAYLAVDLQTDILNTAPLYPQPKQAVLAANERLSAALKNTPALEVMIGVKLETFNHLYPFAATKRHLAQSTPQLALTIAQDASANNVTTVFKHNPSAFFGTDLDLQLRRFGIDTVIIAGVSTANGVYATALDAFQYAYNVIVVTDACADRDAEKHAFFVAKMFARLGTVTTVDELLASL